MLSALFDLLSFSLQADLRDIPLEQIHALTTEVQEHKIILSYRVYTGDRIIGIITSAAAEESSESEKEFYISRVNSSQSKQSS